MGASAESVAGPLPWLESPGFFGLDAPSDDPAHWTDAPYVIQRVVAADTRVRDAPRTVLGRAMSRAMTGRAAARTQWRSAAKPERWLREEFRDTDVLVSMDQATDHLLDRVPQILDGHEVVRYASHGRVSEGLRALADVATTLAGHVSAWQQSEGSKRIRLGDDEWQALRARVAPVSAGVVPGTLLPVTEVAEVVRALGPVAGPAQTAEIVLEILGCFAWDDAPAVGTSGMAAQRVAARIWCATTEADLPGDNEMRAAVAAALDGADRALARGEGRSARGRLLDAMSVIFHRERHAEAISSPLVSDPAAYLAPLWSSRTFQELISGGDSPSLTRLPSRIDQPRVLVLAGAYGTFHEPVVNALAEAAAVTVRGPKLLTPFLNRRLLDPQALEALTVLRGSGPAHEPPDQWGALQVHQELVQSLGRRLRRADVVFTDWADRLTVWASHLVPNGVRLVVRIHSLDALDPWFQLVNWDNVDQVLVVSEPLRRLVEQLLGVAGAHLPVTVVPNLAALDEADQPKEPDAQKTLGMVGWGRRVKDPLWALDLLARLPGWRLLLIGPDLVPGVSGIARAYTEQVRARLLDPEIINRVKIVGWTDDVPGYLRQVGIILSTSLRESWHLGLVEGAASGAVPVVRDWPLLRGLGGARTLFPHGWVVEDLDDAEARIRSVADANDWETARREAQQQARELFDPEQAAQRYRELILGSLLTG